MTSYFVLNFFAPLIITQKNSTGLLDKSTKWADVYRYFFDLFSAIFWVLRVKRRWQKISIVWELPTITSISLEFALINEIIAPTFQPSKCFLIRKFVFGKLHAISPTETQAFCFDFSNSKGVKNNVLFGPGGPGAEKTRVLEFAMIPHEIYLFNYVCQLDFKKRQEKNRSLRRPCISSNWRVCYDEKISNLWGESLKFIRN